jgi:hypothetical protein
MVPLVGAHVAARRGLVVGQLAAVILGILGMHTLVQHCPAPAHAMQATGAMTSMGVATAAEVHDHAVQDSGASGAELPSVVGAAVTGGASGSLGDMLMLCAAMLLGAGALLSLGLRRCRAPAHRVLPGDPSVARPRQSVLRLVRAGPPPIMAFSVIRC